MAHPKRVVPAPVRSPLLTFAALVLALAARPAGAQTCDDTIDFSFHPPAIDFGSRPLGCDSTIIDTLVINEGPGCVPDLTLSRIGSLDITTTPMGLAQIQGPGQILLHLSLRRTTLGEVTVTVKAKWVGINSRSLTLPIRATGLTPGSLVVDPSAPAPVHVDPGGSGEIPFALSDPGPFPLGFTAYAHLLPDPLEVPVPVRPIAIPDTVYDGAGYLWDFGPHGQVMSGTGGVFRGGGTWVAFPPDPQANLDPRSIGLTFGPVDQAGARYLRQVALFPDGGIARYVDQVENLTGAPADVAVELSTNFVLEGSPGIYATSSGDAVATTADRWVVMRPPTTDMPATFVVLAGPGGATAPYFEQGLGAGQPFLDSATRLHLPPHESRSLVWFLGQNWDPAAAVAQCESLTTLSPDALAGLTFAQLERIANFPPSTLLAFTADSAFVTPGDPDLPGRVTLDAVHLSPGDYTGAVHFDLQYPGGVLDVPFDFVVNGDPAVGVPPAPHPGLALRGFAPNPLRRHAGGVRLAYTLPGPGRATITLVDVRGRIAWRRELARTAAGPGVVTLDAAALATLSPGIVWARLEQGGRVTTTRGVILP